MMLVFRYLVDGAIVFEQGDCHCEHERNIIIISQVTCGFRYIFYLTQYKYILSQAQIGLLVILVAAIVNYFVGTFIPPSDEQKSKGVVGYSGEYFSIIRSCKV